MTLLQLKVALAVVEMKTITAAAKSLNISQPNASNSLKLLEEEIGFPIMNRSRSAATVTHRGALFLKYALQILDENDKIMRLRDEEEVYRLRLGTINYYTAAEPFFALCSRHRDDVQTDFRYLSVSVSEGIRALVKGKLDVVAAPVMEHQVAGLVSECKSNSIEMQPICNVPSIMMIRKDHPAASDSRCSHITRGCDTMKNYPYIGLRNLGDENGSTAYNDSDFVQSSYKIFVDDTNARLRMIESTNGFGFGLPSSYRMMVHYGIISFPVPGVSLKLFCLFRPDDSGRREIREYIALLRDEMNSLLSSL